MSSDGDPQDHLRDGRGTATAIAIAKVIAHAAEAEVTAAAGVEARDAVGHITDKRAERS